MLSVRAIVSDRRYWIKQDAAFDWRTVTQASFFDAFLTSVDKFNEVIGTDDDLRNFRKAGGKMITYHGLFDQLIFPRGTYNYYNRVKDSLSDKQKYYRFFPYPNAEHCGGGRASTRRRCSRRSSRGSSTAWSPSTSSPR